MARQIDPTAGPVLEVGPGTGVISEAILERGVAPSQLTLVEYDEAAGPAPGGALSRACM